MIDGHLNLDLLPEVVHRRAVFSPADEAHLLGCAECRAEWALVRGAERLGAERLTGFDARRVAVLVQTRLAAAPRLGGRAWRWPVALAAAAALLLAVWYSPPDRGDSTPQAGASPAELVLHELDSLNVAQLERVLAAIPKETSHVEQVPLGDLTTDALERVLRSMEEE